MGKCKTKAIQSKCSNLQLSTLKINKLFSPNTGKYRPEITPYLDTFHSVLNFVYSSHVKLVLGGSLKIFQECHLIFQNDLDKRMLLSEIVILSWDSRSKPKKRLILI